MKTLRTIGFFTAFALFALSPAGPARAVLLPTTGAFNINFLQTIPVNDTDWDGMFVAEAGVITSFMAEIGNCGGSFCLFDGPVFVAWDGEFLFGSGVGAELGGFIQFDPDDPMWSALSGGDDQDIRREGSYVVTEKIVVPEPSSYLLMIVGLGALAGFSLRRRSSY